MAIDHTVPEALEGERPGARRIGVAMGDLAAMRMPLYPEDLDAERFVALMRRVGRIANTVERRGAQRDIALLETRDALLDLGAFAAVWADAIDRELVGS